MDNNNDDDFENLISRMPDLQASHSIYKSM